MDFTILAVVLLLGVGVPIRNKLIRKYRDKKKNGKRPIRGCIEISGCCM